MAKDEPQRSRSFIGLQGALDRAFSHIAVWSGRHSGLVLGAALALLLVGLYGASKVRMDNSLDSYFDEQDASFRYYKNYIQEFSSDEVIYLLYSAPGREHGPFDLEVMKISIKEVTLRRRKRAGAWELPEN